MLMTGEDICVTCPVRGTYAWTCGSEGIMVEDACEGEARFAYVRLTWPADFCMHCRNWYVSKYFKDLPRHGVCGREVT